MGGLVAIGCHRAHEYRGEPLPRIAEVEALAKRHVTVLVSRELVEEVGERPVILGAEKRLSWRGLRGRQGRQEWVVIWCEGI